jgi:MoxR-like ATPase
MEKDNSTRWWAFTGMRDSSDEGDDKSAYQTKVQAKSPPWRDFGTMPNDRIKNRGKTFVLDPEYPGDTQIINLINAALYLRRPIIVTGPTGVGKSSLAYALAYKLGIDDVLFWPITSHTTLRDGLYRYEIISHIASTTQNVDPSKKKVEIIKHFRLRALGSALAVPAGKMPKVLLIDEIDKSDMDLPNDLLHVLDEGRFRIDELPYYLDDDKQNQDETIEDENGEARVVKNGWVECGSYPIVVMTSNGERELPPPFLRRCIRIHLDFPQKEKLEKIIMQHFGQVGLNEPINKLIARVLEERNEKKKNISIDALLNAVHLYLNAKVKILDDKNQDLADLAASIFDDLSN